MTDTTYSKDLTNITNGDQILHPFIWVSSKSTVFASQKIAKEYTGDTYIYSYVYTGELIKDYKDAGYDKSVIFIEDSNEIWAGGQFFGLSADSVRVINDNFNSLHTSVSKIQNTYVTGVNVTGSGAFITGASLTGSDGKTVTFTTGDIGVDNSGTPRKANQAVSGITITDGNKIKLSYSDVQVKITASGSGDEGKPVISIFL